MAAVDVLVDYKAQTAPAEKDIGKVKEGSKQSKWKNKKKVMVSLLLLLILNRLKRTNLPCPKLKVVSFVMDRIWPKIVLRRRR